MHQAFEKMNIRFGEIRSQLRHHGAAIESIQKEQTSREHNGTRHHETRYIGRSNRHIYEPVDEYEAKSEFWEDDVDDRASEVDSDRVRCRSVGKRRGGIREMIRIEI
ncbi:hypothetical protein AB3S75_034929 [Citrus x aurantiifolia]